MSGVVDKNTRGGWSRVLSGTVNNHGCHFILLVPARDQYFFRFLLRRG